jgi:hypothetical protein
MLALGAACSEGIRQQLVGLHNFARLEMTKIAQIEDPNERLIAMNEYVGKAIAPVSSISLYDDAGTGVLTKQGAGDWKTRERYIHARLRRVVGTTVENHGLKPIDWRAVDEAAVTMDEEVGASTAGAAETVDAKMCEEEEEEEAANEYESADVQMDEERAADCATTAEPAAAGTVKGPKRSTAEVAAKSHKKAKTSKKSILLSVSSMA